LNPEAYLSKFTLNIFYKYLTGNRLNPIKEPISPPAIQALVSVSPARPIIHLIYDSNNSGSSIFYIFSVILNNILKPYDQAILAQPMLGFAGILLYLSKNASSK